jgi:hypothetical protein
MTNEERKFIYLVEDHTGRVTQVCDTEIVAEALRESVTCLHVSYVVYPIEITTEEDLTKGQRNILARLINQDQ